MKDVLEIRIHGRGGQGAKTASQFIAEAALEKGKHIQSFPEYGPERAGAPMKAYNRISDKAITVYSPVVNPDVVMVIDPTLIGPVNVAEGKIYCVDATKISIDSVGKNLPNTPMLGALIKATGIVELEAITESIKKKFLKKLGEDLTNKTIEGVKKAYDAI
jgi:pyruvate ferredoxin oxidoreductase gamma subunit